MTERQQRRLAAILSADIAGYSTLMGADESRTVRDLKGHQAVVLPMIKSYGGRVIDTAGDGILAEFGSVVDAVECAVAIQETMGKRNAEIEPARHMHYRIGINLGDVMYDEARIYGDGINIAARLEGIAEPGGICISGKVYEDIRAKVLLAYEDAGEQRLKNIAHPVRVYRVRLGSTAGVVGSIRPASEKPSIGVLPFQNMSGDPAQEYFADGMVEEIITALSRIRWLFVIARNSTFVYKGRPADIKQIGRELGVLYVLEGSVRKSGSRMRITAQLIDAANGANLWAERFDGSLDDVFQLQDDVALSVAGVIEPTLQAAEVRRAIRRPTNDMSAYDLYLRAHADSDSWDKSKVLRALDLLTQALKLDPHYGPALAMAAHCHASIFINGWADDPERSRTEGIRFSRAALEVAADEPLVLANSAYVLAFFGQEISASLLMMERALRLNPSFARGYMRSGWLKLWAGQPDDAIKDFETFSRLSPRESRAGVFFGTGVAHFFARRLSQASEMLLLSLEATPSWAPIYRFLAACYSHMGEHAKAVRTIERLRAITSVIVPDAGHWRNPEDRKFFLDGVQAAINGA